MNTDLQLNQKQREYKDSKKRREKHILWLKLKMKLQESFLLITGIPAEQLIPVYFRYLSKKNSEAKVSGKFWLMDSYNWGSANPINKKISLAVFSTNKNAIALYKKLGFKQEGRCPRDMIIAGKYVDSILMYKYTK